MEKGKSIKDIARLAGVSTATVSRVINQNGRFSKETEARVRRIIRENEYVPNMSAKGLRTSRTCVVGIIVPDITNPHFSSLVLKLEINLFQRGVFVPYLQHQRIGKAGAQAHPIAFRPERQRHCADFRHTQLFRAGHTARHLCRPPFPQPEKQRRDY